ncbi:MAG: GtrA family protein [Pseudomonadota bacterium]
MKPLIRQIAAFGVTGITATLVHIGIGWTLHRIADLPPFTANLIAFACAASVTYFGNSVITFRARERQAGETPRVAAAILISLALNQLLVIAITGWLSLPYEVALGAIIAIVPATTFLLFKFWAYRS